MFDFSHAVTFSMDAGAITGEVPSVIRLVTVRNLVAFFEIIKTDRNRFSVSQRESHMETAASFLFQSEGAGDVN